MENIKELLNTISQLGIKISAREGKLILNAPKGSMTKALQEQMTIYKSELIEYLEKDSNILKPVRREENIPLSYAQQRLWFLYLLNPESTMYNIPATFSIRGDLDLPAMQKAINQIISRHEILRTNFYLENGATRQVIKDSLEINLKTINIKDQSEINEYYQQEISKPFDLTNDPLIRFTLLKNEDQYIFIMVIHHIIADAWSCGVFANELAVFYKHYLENNSGNGLSNLNLQYVDYTYWQKNLVENNHSQLEYWKNKLKNSTGILPLLTDKKRPDLQTFAGKTIDKKIPENLRNDLKNLAKEKSVTLFVLLISAFQVLLYRYTHEKEIIVGLPVAGRNHKGLENLIGFFVNTLVLKGDLSDDLSFNDFIKQINESTLEAFINQDIPFEKLIEALQIKRNTAFTPLFQVMFVMQNIEVTMPEFPDLEFKLLELENNTAKFDLTLTIKEDSSIFSIEYRTDLFNQNTMERMLENYLTLLESIISNPDERISKLELIKNNQLIPLTKPALVEKKIVENKSTLIHQLVELQALNNPEKIALVFEDKNITYKELNQRANQLAQKLIKQGVEKESKVALFIDVSIEMIIALLAILKSGATYVPLDPSLANQRLKFILEDCQPLILISTSDLKDKIPSSNAQNLFLDQENLENESTDNLDINISEDYLAYIIYTSGSTGNPNGVQISHKNVIRLFTSTDKLFDFNEQDIWVLFHSFAFDYSVWEIWGCFYWGAKLLMISKQLTRNPELFYKKIAQEKVTILNQTPSAFHHFSRQAISFKNKNISNSLKYIVLSGEALDISLLKDWYNNFPDHSPKLINCYGITETTVFVTFYGLNKNDLDSNNRSPIGFALDDLSLYILDKDKKPVPYGVAGELYVSGEGLARGYLNRPQLNNNRFIEVNGQRLYKTGDQVRALDNGHLEYLGRLDQQVKLRGFRIELGEIESALNAYDLIKESVVTINENETGKFLTAYIVTDKNDTSNRIDIQNLKNFLKAKLNEVMIPTIFMEMDFLPLNNNGKVDKRALPEPINIRPENKPYIQPNNDIEVKIANIIKSVIGIDTISSHDNFFDLGAHSLLMIEAHEKLKQDLNINFDLIDIFSYPTIITLAEFLSNKGNKKVKEKSVKKIYKSQDIAIIGMAGKFPGAENIEEFWQNIKEGTESIHFFTDQELKEKGISDEILNNPKYVKANGVLDDIEYFDADFWGYSPREAEILDPQHRLFLECAYNALEHSGYSPDKTDLSIGVFAGTALSRYLLFNLINNQDLVNAVGHFQLLIANDKDYLSTRTAYKLNLKGPAITVQTACSTSLVAVHMACQSILNNECKMALAGGISIDTQRQGYIYQEGSIASPDGHCRAFDEKANGIVGGSGLGIIVLKKLEKAVEDNDSIYAVIKGSAINNDGSQKIGFLAPSVSGQTEVIIEAIEKSGINPEDIDYIETHGTATPIGDPIEVSALNNAYANFTEKKEYCAIGSVKTNIGHLDMAAGIAGLIKTVQSLRYKQIPPSLHFNKANPKINFLNSPFFVNNQLKNWIAKDKPRLAAVSAFGVGGTNAHAILSEAPVIIDNQEKDKEELIVLSAKSLNSLDKMIVNFKDFIKSSEANIKLKDIAYTLQIGRKEFNYRYAFAASNKQKIVDSLDRYKRDLIKPISGKNKIVFMFSGLGTQYSQMGYQLYQNENVFKENMDLCFGILKTDFDMDLKDILFKEDEKINTASFMQISIFVFEYSLAQLWISKGIKPYALIGNSFGEYIAACLAECFSLKEALNLVVKRGRLFEKIKGSTLAVSSAEENIKEFLNENLSLASVNSDHLCLVSGLEDDIVALQKTLRSHRIASSKTEIPHATHSNLVQPIIKEFKEELEKINWKNPNIPMISNLSGEFFQKDQLNTEYWLEQVLNTVRFYQGIKTLAKEKELIFLEIGSGNSLTHLLKKNKTEHFNAFSSIAVKQHKEIEYEHFLNTIGELWSHGLTINFDYFKKSRRIALPTYPFEKKRFWIEPQNLAQENFNHNQAKRNENIEDWFYIPSWKRSIKNYITEDNFKYLVFTKNQNFYNQLKEKNEIYLVTTNNNLDLTDKYFLIEDQSKASLELIFNKLNDQNLLPEHIIYDCSESYENDSEQFNNLISLFQVLGEYKQKFSINLVTNDLYKVSGLENTNPNRSLITGPAKVVNQEYKNINCKIIDTDKLSSIKNIIAEFDNNDQKTIAYRNNYRWLPTFEKVKLLAEKNISLRKNGTYIITGGLGGIGLTLAEYLAENYQANLILINRNKYEKNQVIEKIKALGSKVIIETADVTDLEKMNEIFEKTYQTFGQINGVIHSAGLAGKDLIYQKNIQDNQILDVKVKGTKILAKLAEQYNLDFMLLCSSLNSVLGGVGQAEYTSANAFLDSFAEYMTDEKLKVISLNWGAWKNVGMAQKMNNDIPDFLKNIYESILPDQGKEIFEKVLNSGFSQVLASPVNFEAMQEKYKHFSFAKGNELLVEIENALKNRNIYARPDLSSEYIEAQTDLEKTIAAVWQHTLGIDKIGLDDNFFELGGDSLLLAGIKIQLEDKLNYELPMSIMFHSSTIRELANHLDYQKQESNLLVKLKPTGNKEPFFCIHAISGTTFPFTYLAANFNDDRPFYGIQAQGLADNKSPVSDIKEMAANYVGLIKSIQPEGKYYIGGWSFGAIVALEIAQQLKKEGKEVEKLVVIDMKAPTDNSLLLKDSINEEDLKQRFIEDMKGLFNKSINFENSEIIKLFNVFKANIQASYNYNSENYSGKINVFRADNGMFKDIQENDLGWNQISENISLNIIAGDHYTILKSEKLVQKINEILP